MAPGHYHLHANDGVCYGDYRDFDEAILRTAELQASWLTPWGSAPLTVIDAPICINRCNDNAATYQEGN